MAQTGCRGRTSNDTSREEHRRHLQDAAIREDGAVLDDILQFSDVAGPAVLDQAIHRLGVDARKLSPQPIRRLRQEVTSEAWNVFAPFSQWRQMDWKHCEAIIEISPEEAIVHGLFEIAIRG